MITKVSAIKYNHNSITVSGVRKKVNFTIFTPKEIPADWTLEIKTYPWGEKKKFSYFRLHYMDSKDTQLMVSIEQSRGYLSYDGVTSPNTKQVDINGNKGYFSEWGNDGELDKQGQIITGGILSWKQDGTYLEMYSSRLPQEKMLEIASSMK